jgi:hypothetical protein
MLAYKEAPDSASGLESSEAPLSAGHLILVLRWCSQFFTEERNSLFPYDTTSAIVRLAELTSAFLGLELTVREQSGVQHQPQSRQLLAEQVLDLFGEATEFNGAATTMREGQLKPLLSSSMWQGTRSQLQSYLEAAVTFAALPQSTGGGSFSFHASEGNSPFQDVNMYQ